MLSIVRVLLYKRGDVYFRLLGMNGFHLKAKNERFTLASSRCRQNFKNKNFTSSFGRLRQKIAPKSAARLYFLIVALSFAVAVVVSWPPYHIFLRQSGHAPRPSGCWYLRCSILLVVLTLKKRLAAPVTNHHANLLWVMETWYFCIIYSGYGTSSWVSRIHLRDG